MRQFISASAWLFMAFVAINGSLVAAQVPFPGRCPEVNITNNFDVEAYMGVWYEHSKYPFIFEIGQKCMYARYEVLDNTTVSVLNVGINRFTGNPTNVTGNATVVGPGQLSVSFNKKQDPTKANYIVLGTDYKNYSVVYSCSNIAGLANLKIVWILTRERQPTQETLQTAYNVIDNYKISRTFLVNTIQDSCPSLNGNGTDVTGNDFTANLVSNAIEGA